MNTISNSTSSVTDLYSLQKTQAAQDLQDYLDNQQQIKKQNQKDLLQISDESTQALANSTQAIVSNSALTSLVSDGTITKAQEEAIQDSFKVQL